MSDRERIWTSYMVSRRVALRRVAVAGGGGVAALSLLACRGDATTTSTSAPATPQARATVDPTAGVRGGRLVIQGAGDQGGTLALVRARVATIHQAAGFTHDGVLEYRNGTPAHDGYDILPQPNLAQTMPEQPDGLTYVVKLRPAKFHNGRTVTSEDVKYSYERFASGADSAYKSDWFWLDTVETPDPQTAVIKTKGIYAETLQSMAARYDAEVLAREHEESPDAEKKLLGSGPFLFEEYQPPLVVRFKRNPDYHRQPYPYFDAIELTNATDPEKKVADFVSRQAQMSYWFPAEERDRIKQQRPDAQLFTYMTGFAGVVIMRTDKPPLSDPRVRQALSMATDRGALSQAITQGEGEPDQVLSIAGRYWGFRKPSELGAAAKYWNHDVAEAKRLLTAAGVNLPLELTMPHWNATVVGQKHVDAATLIQSQWRSAGIANVRTSEVTFAQSQSTYAIGNYDSMCFSPNPIGYDPRMGTQLRYYFWSPPEGIKGPPTTNNGYVNNPELNMLITKQLSELDKEERIKSLRRIEELIAEQQYRLTTVTSTFNYFGDRTVKNMQTPRDAYNGALPYVKYWWFDGGKAP